MPRTRVPERLEKRAREIVEALDGTWSRSRGMCCCPAHDDRTPSLSVTIGVRAILFHCFAGCSNEAVLASLGRIGVKAAELFDGRGEPIAARTRDDVVNQNALRLWRAASALTEGPAQTYLAGRQIRISSPDLRYHARTPLGPKGSVRFLPAMLAAVRNDEGILALHRTFLEPKTFRLARFDGPSRVGSDGREHRAGTDLTFSMPKSWSLLALVGGDKRIIDAYAAAVKETLAWAEKNLAETRMEVRGREKIAQTGNLLVALFQHDTNRNQEPGAHIHAVVANVTQGPDGKWRALRNDKLWEHNTLLNAMTMARFRLSVEKLGYEIGEIGKHGNFEAAGVPRHVRDAFSSRRAEIVVALEGMNGKGLAARNAANLMTRAAKHTIEDRGALGQQWREQAARNGFDPAEVIARANGRAAIDIGTVPTFGGFVRDVVEHGRGIAQALAERLGLRAGDPLVPRDLARKSPQEIAAVHAVASAVRHLSEREAAFARTDIYKAALGFGLPAAMPEIERRVEQLLRQGELVRGKGADRGLVTTAGAIAAEQRIVAAVEAGRGIAPPIVDPAEAGARLQALSQLKYGMTLNQGQEAAGRLLLGSSNRIVAIQGVAGAGKSTVLQPVADILREEGKAVLGLAVQNTLVQMLERDTGIPSMTVARFLKRHAALLEGGDKAALASARSELRGTVVLLDEASMVGNTDKEKLVQLANLLELSRFASIGDAKQLGAVDAGKPFEVMQKAGVETATMNINLRGRDRALRAAQHAAQGGQIDEALRYLGSNVVEVGEGAAIDAAAAWLALAPADRERTAIYASGRTLRSEVNEAVQTGLKANGELGQPALKLDVLARVNTTREELRYAGTYLRGMVVEVDRDKRAQGLTRGTYQVVESDMKRERVTLENGRGKQFEFRPGKLRPQGEHDPLRLYEVKPLELHAGDRSLVGQDCRDRIGNHRPG